VSLELLLGEFDLSSVRLPTPVALAIVTVIGYLIGRRRRSGDDEADNQARRELKRAQAVAKELEKIADLVRRHLATHHASVVRFKNRMVSLGGTHNESAWQELCKESESMLKPTLKLAAQLANAYDEIRQQSNHLMTFTEVRTDPLTGVSNRRALDETLISMFAMMNRYELPFSIVIVDIDHFKKINDEQGHLYGDSILKSVAKVLDDNVRDTDIVTRYGGEEFVIVMPQTALPGACIFSDRLRQNVEQKLPLTISGGVAAAVDGDNPQTLLARADAALYSAKAAGRNRTYFHTGLEIRPSEENVSDEEAPFPVLPEKLEGVPTELPQPQAG
jgi:diguanylate cyclase (GGDEF)-like protein